MGYTTTISAPREIFEALAKKNIKYSHAFRVGADRLLNGRDDVEQRFLEQKQEYNDLRKNFERLSRRLAENQIEMQELKKSPSPATPTPKDPEKGFFS